jgi:hypothetical protein
LGAIGTGVEKTCLGSIAWNVLEACTRATTMPVSGATKNNSDPSRLQMGFTAAEGGRSH